MPPEAAGAGQQRARGVLLSRLLPQFLPPSVPDLRTADGAQDRASARLRQTQVPQRFGDSLPISPAKKPVNKGLEMPNADDRAWRSVAAPELTADQLSGATVPDGPNGRWESGGYQRVETRNKMRLRKHFAEQAADCLIQPHHPPVNVLGGYRFPEAPAIDVPPTKFVATKPRTTVTRDGLDIPDLYAARPEIQERTGKQLDDQYFTQTLLPNYMEEHGVDWDVVFDDRGHFREPHTGRGIGLGTLSVRRYQSKIEQLDFEEPCFTSASVVTRGPSGCFGGVLFIEKEGFMPLFEAVNLAERFDIALMSTKGLSNTAARQLIDEMCGGQEIPLLVLHDFDKAGFSILGTLQRDTRRYRFMNDVEVIDLGLRLEDIEGLQREDAFDKGTRNARAENLRENGATDAEINFLLDYRVELNAMTSDQLVTFVERKLEHHGIKKVIPDDEELAEAYRLFARSQEVEQIIEGELERLDDNDDAAEVPPDIKSRVREYLVHHPEARWDAAVQYLVANASKLKR
jgi:hypothetical protein